MRTASLSLLTILCLLLAVAPAMADTLYTNGPPNGTTDAWVINFGFSVSDSFICPRYNSCFVEGFGIVTWNSPGDNLSNLEMQLGASPFGNYYYDQVLAPTTSMDLGPNQYGLELWEYEFTVAGVDVPSGTNWITLQNANVPSGDPIYWDENSGPSSAFENTIGSIPSESFTVTGCLPCACGIRGPDCGPPTPEPSSIMLFGSGILGLAGVLRRKLGR
jgi:hypothetical protein